MMPNVNHSDPSLNLRTIVCLSSSVVVVVV